MMQRTQGPLLLVNLWCLAGVFSIIGLVQLSDRAGNAIEDTSPHSILRSNAPLTACSFLRPPDFLALPETRDEGPEGHFQRKLPYYRRRPPSEFVNEILDLVKWVEDEPR